MKFSKLRLAHTLIKNRGFLPKIPVLFRMVKSILKRQYPLRKSMKWAIVLITVYIISPLDFLPDWIPFLGIFDDLGLLAIIISKLAKEVDDFLLWESENQVK